ncbi:MAG: hypothetical protein J7L23_00590 [Candidatus Diapherotrites archaeon]|nr:hypothetical protein [Candidatus Diapherotrites archaeon]
MQKAISEIVSFVVIITIVLASAVSIYYWIEGRKTPHLDEEELEISAYAINSTAIRVMNRGTENSTELTAMNTSVGPCTFSSSTILQPGVPVRCSLSSPVPDGTSVVVYGPGIKATQVKF